MKTFEVRWFLIVLLFPAVALARPVDEGTEVRASGSGGRFFYEAGCASGPTHRYQADHAGLGASVHHRDGALRGSVGVQSAGVEVTRGVTLGPASCVEDGALNDPNCEKATPPDIGTSDQQTVVTGRIGFETPYLGLEIGPALIVGDRAGNVPMVLSLGTWFGLPELHGTFELMPYHNREPGATARLGLGHSSEALRLGIGIDLTIPMLSQQIDEIPLGKFTADAQMRVSDRLWIGAGIGFADHTGGQLTDFSGQILLTFEL